MDNYLKKYNIDLETIKKHISEASVRKKPVDDRPEETYTPDIIDQYTKFAEEKMGIKFNDITLFITALTHRSFVILELVVSDFLYQNFHEPEGIMTAWRSALVRTESIGAASEKIGYVSLIRLSKGEKLGSSRTHASIIADCFEAVTGAIYLDQGFDAAKDFIYQHIICKMDDVILSESWRDAKSYLQELAQKFEGSTPQYHVIKEEGPDHDRIFTINVVVAGHNRGTGIGHSKQEAQSAAAAEGIKYYKKQSTDQSLVTGKLSLIK